MFFGKGRVYARDRDQPVLADDSSGTNFWLCAISVVDLRQDILESRTPLGMK